MADSKLTIATQMMAYYNAQDKGAYVALMADDACEAAYRRAVLREGKEGTRAGLKTMFAEYPEICAQLKDFISLAPQIAKGAMV